MLIQALLSETFLVLALRSLLGSVLKLGGMPEQCLSAGHQGSCSGYVPQGPTLDMRVAYAILVLCGLMSISYWVRSQRNLDHEPSRSALRALAFDLSPQFRRPNGSAETIVG